MRGAIVHRRDVRRSSWVDEVAEYFGVPPSLLLQAVADRRVEAHEAPPDVREARETLERRFMAPASVALLRKIQTAPPADVSDLERSASWKEYIFLCVNAEKRAFERIWFYDAILAGVVRPLLEVKERPLVVDYGCGSSLLTRMIAQDFGDRVRTVSVDVCRYAVEFSVARNRLYNAGAEGLVLDDVSAALDLSGADLILAYSVFEHLPDSTRQIEALVDALAPNGILVENYAGHSRTTPHKSDTFSAYTCRDVNLGLLRGRLALLHGALPRMHAGTYAEDARERFWIDPNADAAFCRRVSAALRRELGVTKSVVRKLLHGLRRLPGAASVLGAP